MLEGRVRIVGENTLESVLRLLIELRAATPGGGDPPPPPVEAVDRRCGDKGRRCGDADESESVDLLSVHHFSFIFLFCFFGKYFRGVGLGWGWVWGKRRSEGGGKEKNPTIVNQR